MIRPIRSIQPLSDDQIRRVAPSVFATQPWEGVSDRYRYLPTIAVVEMLRAQSFEVIKASQSRTRIPGKADFTKHMLRFRSVEFLTNPPVGGEIPEIVLTNSHAGNAAYNVMAGIFRTVCTNGLIVQSSSFGNIRVRHVGDSDLQAQILEATAEIIEAAPQIINQIEGWKNTPLTRPQQEAFATAVLELKPTTIELKPTQLLSPRRREDYNSDLWTTANVVQENVIKGGLRSRTPAGRRTSTRAVKAVDADLRFNKALWKLTEEMGRLTSSAVG